MLKFIEDHGYEKGIKWEGSLPALKTAKGPGLYKSKAWTDLAPQRDKAYRSVRRYVVEVER